MNTASAAAAAPALVARWVRRRAAIATASAHAATRMMSRSPGSPSSARFWSHRLCVLRTDSGFVAFRFHQNSYVPAPVPSIGCASTAWMADFHSW